MKIYHTGDCVPYENTVVALGEFNGLHVAHMNLINNAAYFAKKNKLPFGVMCFEEKLGESAGKCSSEWLLEPDERERLLSWCDFLYIQKFDNSFKSLSPHEFCVFLTKKLKVKTVYAGFNYRFGKGASGNADTLSAFNGFDTHIIDEYKKDGVTVSSTAIRGLIADGNIDAANRLLGRCYSLSGIVEYGKQNGRILGFPTVNLCYNKQMTLPHTGVYAGYTYVNGKKYKSVINIGNNPTFNGDRITIESYIFNFDKDVYGENVKIDFLQKIRPDIKFNSLSELKTQIAADKQKAENILERK